MMFTRGELIKIALNPFQKFYSTTEFLAQNPMNISNGFRYCIEFGVDYNIQSRVCDGIPSLFDRGIRQHLKHHFEVYL